MERRYECLPYGDGSSPDGFGNICDNKLEAIIAREVPIELGKQIADWLELEHQFD